MLSPLFVMSVKVGVDNDSGVGVVDNGVILSPDGMLSPLFVISLKVGVDNVGVADIDDTDVTKLDVGVNAGWLLPS